MFLRLNAANKSGVGIPRNVLAPGDLCVELGVEVCRWISLHRRQVLRRPCFGEALGTLLGEVHRLPEHNFLVLWLFLLFGDLHDIVPHVLNRLEELQVFGADVIPGVVVGSLEQVVVHVVNRVHGLVEFIIVSSL